MICAVHPDVAVAVAHRRRLHAVIDVERLVRVIDAGDGGPLRTGNRAANEIACLEGLGVDDGAGGIGDGVHVRY